MQPTQPMQPPLAETVEPAASSQVVGAAPAVIPAPAVEIHAKISDLKEEPRKWNWTKWAAGLPEGTVTYADLHEKAARYFDLDARPGPDATFYLTYMDEDGDVRLKDTSNVSYMVEQALAGSRTSPVMLKFTLVRLPDRAGPTQQAQQQAQKQAQQAQMQAQLQAQAQLQGQLPAQQFVVPPGVGPGQPFHVQLNGQRLTVLCPPGVQAGQQIPVQLPAAVAAQAPQPQPPAEMEPDYIDA